MSLLLLHIVAYAAAASATASTLTAAAIPFDHSLPCMVAPVSKVQPGELMSFTMLSDSNTPCEMVVNFENNDVLPLSLQVTPGKCSGNQIVNWSIAEGVPNGLMSVQWQCQGNPSISCNVLRVHNGCDSPADYGYVVRDSVIQVACSDEEDQRGNSIA